MDRRTFILDTASAALWAAGCNAAADARRDATRLGAEFAAIDVAVFDPSLARGRRLAREAARRAVRAFALERHADIGALWHARIAPRVARRAALAAALRPADAFVLARLASTLDCRVIDAAPPAKTDNRDSSDRT
jgi:hypothetical protein